MKGIAILFAVLLLSAVMIGLKLKFYSYIFGEGGLLGPEDHSLSHEIKNLAKLRDQGLIDAEKYEEMKAELLLRYNPLSHSADKEIQKLEMLQQQNIITSEELEEIKKKVNICKK
ncbi:MAG: SHOCT domain-containing protein [Bacteroidaceae bacterium]|nr:SHOCT domain-containing protein [Bacteroidaceae bacterium]